jgi:hypothetical protein
MFVRFHQNKCSLISLSKVLLQKEAWGYHKKKKRERKEKKNRKTGKERKRKKEMIRKNKRKMRIKRAHVLTKISKVPIERDVF